MSAPDARTVNVPPDALAVPAAPTLPTSRSSHPAGSDPPLEPPLEIDTESNVAVASVPSAWLLTARPTGAVGRGAMVSVRTRDQFERFADWYARTASPVRVSPPQQGAVTEAPAECDVAPPLDGRR